MATFDDELISGYIQISNNLLHSRDEIKKRLDASSSINGEMRILLEYLNGESLTMLSLIFKHSTIFMRVLNDDYLTTISFEKFVDSLPDEFHVQKKQWKSEITKHKLETDSQIQTLKEKLSHYDEISNFIRWEKRLREDEVKEREEPDTE